MFIETHPKSFPQLIRLKHSFNSITHKHKINQITCVKHANTKIEENELNFNNKKEELQEVI